MSLLTDRHVRALSSYDATKALSDREAEALTDALTSARAGVEAPLIEALGQEYQRQATEVEANLDDVLASAEAEGWSPQWLWILLGAAAFETFVDTTARALLVTIAEEGLSAGGIVMGAGVPEAFAISPGALATLDESIALIKNTDAETRRVLGKIMREGTAQSASRRDISRVIRAQFNDWSSWRAATVAQTASTPVYAHTLTDAYASYGATGKGWLSVLDSATRESHVEANGQEVGINESFTVGGVSMRFPGDPRAPARETVGCRCSIFPVVPPPVYREKTADEQAAWLKMKPHERGRIDMAVRDLSVRTCYPPLRDAMGQLGAIAYLATEFSMSESNVKNVVIKPKQ